MTLKFNTQVIDFWIAENNFIYVANEHGFYPLSLPITDKEYQVLSSMMHCCYFGHRGDLTINTKCTCLIQYPNVPCNNYPGFPFGSRLMGGGQNNRKYFAYCPQTIGIILPIVLFHF